ncbi:hypothetical protein M407DRAFT_241913 [Tulasnella calospora MUT 4182]|uniref:Uncharacterized protein n=1 Tax=Tulasnella calospora MUT 4182 TaxID=1051891 RepID=A0A0C3QT18_9AGAM|nr:hypothetical protein M407DRAFT_241913 [Tulasnella calospora MUT 4182]
MGLFVNRLTMRGDERGKETRKEKRRRQRGNETREENAAGESKEMVVAVSFSQSVDSLTVLQLSRSHKPPRHALWPNMLGVLSHRLH